jgi:hypothetical protein
MTFTVDGIAQRFHVDPHTVLLWIKRGELVGIDVSRNRGIRPRWRITAEALATFELARTNQPIPKATRRKKQAKEVLNFY